MAADFIAAVLQKFDLLPGVGREPVVVEQLVVGKFAATRDVFGRDEVSDGQGRFFGEGAKVPKIVGVPVGEGDGDSGPLDPAFPHKIDCLAKTYSAIVPKQVIHLPQEVRSRNSEAMWPV